MTAKGPWRLNWPVSVEQVGRARLKTTPDDFRVSEVLPPALLPSGTGEHLMLHLEKSGDNTEYVARTLARLSGCRDFDVGFCGMKDRHAVTRQWFSVYRPGLEAGDADFLAAVGEHWNLLDSGRSPRKLRRGEHLANDFVIVLRSLDAPQASLEAALNRLAEQGAPNYFGPQRFGHQGGNLERAAALDSARPMAGRRGGKRSSKNVLYFSAARAWLFNEVLASRVSDGTWHTPVEGDPAPDDQAPSGPLWGDGGTSATGTLAERERAVIDGRVDGAGVGAARLLPLFATTRMRPERRPLVIRPEALDWRCLGDGVLELRFRLAPGQYATTVIGDILALTDASLSAPAPNHNDR